MTVSKHHAYFTPEDYLTIECISPIKHKYPQGRMVTSLLLSKNKSWSNSFSANLTTCGFPKFIESGTPLNLLMLASLA